MSILMALTLSLSASANPEAIDPVGVPCGGSFNLPPSAYPYLNIIDTGVDIRIQIDDWIYGFLPNTGATYEVYVGYPVSVPIPVGPGATGADCLSWIDLSGPLIPLSTLTTEVPMVVDSSYAATAYLPYPGLSGETVVVQAVRLDGPDLVVTNGVLVTFP